MFWLPVKGLAQWRHTSFPGLSFLPLLSPLCFSQSALAAQGPRRCGALELEAQDSDLLEWSVGHCCHVGRSPEPRGENPGLGPTLPLRTNNASPPMAWTETPVALAEGHVRNCLQASVGKLLPL